MFELYEASENEIMPFRDAHFEADGERFPPSLMKLDCWLDNVTLTASMMRCLVQMVSHQGTRTCADLESIVERHFVSILERKIRPIISNNIQDLITATPLLTNGASGMM